MQAPAGRELLLRNGLDPDDPASFLLFEQGRGYTDTEGIARVLRSFGGVWAYQACSLAWFHASFAIGCIDGLPATDIGFSADMTPA